ncbi:bifunctional coenzyme A synthase-like, partial [Lingula anatina]|uniref:Bifunctional coenzyme A synthase-like n=1 Tax=Lingula anatina TaxID=7574 RepID=A0A1S3IE76_LINAN
MFKCGLLILTSPLSKIPQCISALLSASMKYVSETLYIHIEPGWKGGPSLANQKFGSFQCRPTVLIRNVTTGVYANAASTCGQLDVRVLLSSFTAKQAPHSQQTLRRAYDIILTDHKLHAGFAEQVLEKYPLAIIPNVQVLEANTSLGGCHTESGDTLSTEDVPLGTYDYIALGGTFDRFHGGHKILLSEACLICDRFLTVGVTDGDMNA